MYTRLGFYTVLRALWLLGTGAFVGNLFWCPIVSHPCTATGYNELRVKARCCSKVLPMCSLGQQSE